METDTQSAATPPPSSQVVPRLAKVIGFLVFTEIVYGILRGFYGPLVSDISVRLGISDGAFNWFETAQHTMAVLMVIVFARLGDVRGLKRVLLWTTTVTAAGAWILVFAPSFTTFLVGYVLMGACAVWLPLEIAIVYKRTAGSEHQHRLSRRAAGILVSAFYLSIVLGAVFGGALADAVPLPVVLSIPAVLATAATVVVWFGIENDEPTATATNLDWVGLGLLMASLGSFLAGMVAIHLQGVTSPLAWALVVVGLAIQIPFARYESRQSEPIIDVQLLKIRAQWPVQVAGFLYGLALIGGEIPNITYFGTDPDAVGYGLGVGAGFVSLGIASQVVCIAIGALSFPTMANLLGARRAVVLAAFVGALGAGLWLPFHDSPGMALVNLGITGLGAGAVMAALPVLAATAAPPDRTGFATGMNSVVKNLGGTIATAIFAIVLSATGSLDAAADRFAPFSGYVTVWSTCAAAALLAGFVLMLLPRSIDREPVASKAD
ncbi:MFS transporter [Aeromicrobium sp. CF4.19]|uniref:MFS transporter n=1 Tax=Aeromicrobium sp. CF4.19 TaxID=3373082 RepID=UPI003EE79B41